MELEEGDISNGSDTEVEEDLGYMLGEENALEEVRHKRVLDELDNIVRNMSVCLTAKAIKSLLDFKTRG